MMSFPVGSVIHTSMALVEPPLWGAPVTKGWCHSTTIATNSPGTNGGMVTGSIVVVAVGVPDGAKFSNFSPELGDEVETKEKFGLLLSYASVPLLPAEEK